MNFCIQVVDVQLCTQNSKSLKLAKQNINGRVYNISEISCGAHLCLLVVNPANCIFSKGQLYNPVLSTLSWNKWLPVIALFILLNCLLIKIFNSLYLNSDAKNIIGLYGISLKEHLITSVLLSCSNLRNSGTFYKYRIKLKKNL